MFSIEIVVADQVRTALLRTLGSILEPTRVAAGCLSVRLYSDLDENEKLSCSLKNGNRAISSSTMLIPAKLNAIVGAMTNDYPAESAGGSP